MSLLFPLYALGALALAAPILFHLFQRRPHGQQEFSSLMFLQATPPKLTRRSRLSDLFLLLLRGLALLLLAAAFARPFLRSSSLLDLDAPSRSVALLIDTSASLRRAGLWEDMKKSINQVVGDLQPTDEVMLVSYDREPTVLFSFEAWGELTPTQRVPFLKEQIRGLQPTWYATDLSSAAIAASDALLQQRLVEDQRQALQVIVFTDLQKGSDLTGLQSYEWPEEISVDIRTVAVKKRTNASIQALPPEASDMDATQVRVLVRNEADSDRGQFQIQRDAANSKTVDVYVPPGQTRVVRITQPRGAQQLNLLGDDNSFDNELYLTETTPQRQKLLYLGDESADDQQGLFFYLRQSALDTRSREVKIEQLEDLTQLATLLPQQVPLCVLSEPLSGASLTDLKRYVSRGGRLLVILKHRAPRQSGQPADWTDMESFLTALLDVPDIKVNGENAREYEMLADIDFQHPLFAPFADPRFNDFTKIKYWSHRVLSSSVDDVWTSIAKYEDESPALIEKRMDDGTVWVLTSGWQPSESQLALSTKFIPLLHGFFGQSPRAANRMTSYEVGDRLNLVDAKQPTSVLSPGGETFVMSADSDSFADVNQPGIYEIRQGTNQFEIAVNLAKSESQTAQLLPDRLEQLGLRLRRQRSAEAIKTEQRQMRNKELEGQQKLWRWGILAALVLVVLETLVSSRKVVRTLGVP